MERTKIVSDPQVLDGEPRLEGTRISAWKIHDMYNTMEMSLQEIAKEPPTVDIEGVKAAVEYTEDRQKDESPATA